MRDRSAECLPPTLLERIGALATTRAYARHAIIVSEGDETDSVYVLVAGRVKVFVSDADGRDVTLNQLGPGEYFGEITLDGGPRSASVMALEETRCAVVKRAELVALVERTPEFALHMVRKLARRVRALTDNVRSLAFKDIASRVGASREMVSRIFSDLAEGGYVRKDGKRLLIVRKPPPRW